MDAFPSHPPALPSYDADPSRDADHLRLLVIGHRIVFGLHLAGLLLLILHGLIMGLLFGSVGKGGLSGSGLPSPFPQVWFGIVGIFYLIGGGILVLGIVLNFLAARGLHKRTSRTICLITAGYNCLHMPLGTVLGVFSFMILERSPVRLAFTKPSGI
jgi:hypothetical protein